MNTDELNAARREKALDRLYNFSGKTCTLRQYLADNPPISRSVTTRTHEHKKRDCEYKTIKAVQEYSLWADEKSGIEVPKLVFDLYPDLPTKEYNW
ncbi:MAG: hypothetical protein EHM33_15265 [Chloroflexi bacterium]|nr:MAG: hypothetical protein EHM33_15265 [Chloroflexota bacterium]